MAWLLLTAAIVAEVAATISLKAAGEGHVPAIAVVAFGYGTAFTLLALLVKRMDVGVAYAVWSGVGTALVAVVGAVALGEPLGPLKLAGLGMIIGGVVTLNLAGAH